MTSIFTYVESGEEAPTTAVMILKQWVSKYLSIGVPNAHKVKHSLLVPNKELVCGMDSFGHRPLPTSVHLGRHIDVMRVSLSQSRLQLPLFLFNRS